MTRAAGIRMAAIVTCGRSAVRDSPRSRSRRSRRSAARRRRRSRRLSWASRPSPRRSSFGARLRKRVPQYGHSVTYGLTSDPQLLQTTLSSVSLTPARISAGSSGRGLRVRSLDDLRRQSPQVLAVVVGESDLAVRARAVRQQVLDPVELRAAAELVGVL